MSVTILQSGCPFSRYVEAVEVWESKFRRALFKRQWHLRVHRGNNTNVYTFNSIVLLTVSVLRCVTQILACYDNVLRNRTVHSFYVCEVRHIFYAIDNINIILLFSFYSPTVISVDLCSFAFNKWLFQFVCSLISRLSLVYHRILMKTNFISLSRHFNNNAPQGITFARSPLVITARIILLSRDHARQGYGGLP